VGLPSAYSRPESGADREPDQNPSGRVGLFRGRSEQFILHCARCRNRGDLCARLGCALRPVLPRPQLAQDGGLLCLVELQVTVFERIQLLLA